MSNQDHLRPEATEGATPGSGSIRQDTPTTPGGEVRVYEPPDGKVRVDVRLERETVWLSLTQMAELFGRDKSGTTDRRGTACRAPTPPPPVRDARRTNG